MKLEADEKEILNSVERDALERHALGCILPVLGRTKAIVNKMHGLIVECPVCHASNPAGSLACFKCSTLIEIHDGPPILDPAERPATIVKPAGGPSNQEATIGGTA